ncbi:hypothetical protein BKA57DRAFT_537357 [Linnemannia elongata]|nr:hypothetical protein BKA57DRAFT_537357 [Linnemannia elongata]
MDPLDHIPSGAPWTGVTIHYSDSPTCINGPGAVSTSTIIPVSPRQVRARTSLQEPDFPGPTGQFTGLTQNGGYPAPYEDLEDEDDIADQEMEQEKQRTSSVTRMLLESPTLQGALAVDYIRACFHQPGLVSDMECDAVIETVQALRDYVPRRRLKTTGGTAPPAQHVATMIGVVLIANQVARIGGYPDFAMRIAPSPSVGSLHTLPLAPAGVYEALCSLTKGHFDPHVTKETAVTSVPKARSRANALFECFFDMDRIRLKYVDRHTIHILGDVIPEGQERGPGAPVRRELVEESKKKGSKGTRGGVYWSREGERIGVTQEIARDKAKQAQKRLLTLETDQKDLRKVYLQADSDRSDASKIVKALSKGERPALEDRTKSLYLNGIFKSTGADSNKAIGFSSDDPGLSVMQISATLTHGQVSQYIHHYFETLNPFGALVEDESESLVDGIVDLPPISRITSLLLDDLTFSRQHARNRERDLAEDCDVPKAARAAVQRLSDAPITTATTLDERLRTKRSYATLAAAQRWGIKAEVQNEIRQMLKAKTEKTMKTDEELHELGEEEATTTDAKMDSKDNAARALAPVCRVIPSAAEGKCVTDTVSTVSLPIPTNRGRVSYALPLSNLWGWLLQLVLKTERSKTSAFHGVVICRNRDCPRFKTKKSTLGRDSNAAINIAVAVVPQWV